MGCFVTYPSLSHFYLLYTHTFPFITNYCLNWGEVKRNGLLFCIKQFSFFFSPVLLDKITKFFLFYSPSPFPSSKTQSGLLKFFWHVIFYPLTLVMNVCLCFQCCSSSNKPCNYCKRPTSIRLLFAMQNQVILLSSLVYQTEWVSLSIPITFLLFPSFLLASTPDRYCPLNFYLNLWQYG